MAAALSIYRSSLGKKFVMAITGIILFGFVFAHMVGNLKIYQGREHLNEYAHFLRVVGGPVFGNSQLLWIMRLVLIVSVVLHIVAAYQLTRMSKRSRPVGYARRRDVQATYASRTMRWGGIIILLFVIYHLLHFTFGVAQAGFRRDDVYQNVINGFSVWYISFFYILAMLALGMHLLHGLWSMFQSLGLNNRRWNGLLRGFAMVFAALVVLGNASIPVAVLIGFLR
jgi:succinate dehydrogenase / fumarate reductase, cytochrome b subunit